MKISSLLHLLIAFGCGAVLFWTSQSVQDKERQIAQTRTVLAQEQEAIRVLSTEWDYLNSPLRLEKLATQGVGMDEQSNKDGVGIVDKVGAIPEPLRPALPSIKPASLSRIVPAAGQQLENGVIIPNASDKARFENVLNTMQEGGAE